MQEQKTSLLVPLIGEHNLRSRLRLRDKAKPNRIHALRLARSVVLKPVVRAPLHPVVHALHQPIVRAPPEPISKRRPRREGYARVDARNEGGVSCWCVLLPMKIG